MSGVVARRYSQPLEQGGVGVRVDTSLITGNHGILLVPTFVNTEPEDIEFLSLEARAHKELEVRSYRAAYDVGYGLWDLTRQLQHQSSHADRYALSLIAGTGRNRA